MYILKKQKTEVIMLPIMFNERLFPTSVRELMENNLFDAGITKIPATNVIENENEYLIEISSPGLHKEDYTVKIDENGYVCISAETKTESEKKGKNNNYIRKEFSTSSFSKKFSLPEDADENSITAKSENGILYISIPKLKEREESKEERIIKIS